MALFSTMFGWTILRRRASYVERVNLMVVWLCKHVNYALKSLLWRVG